jgi:hypothetical protein
MNRDKDVRKVYVCGVDWRHEIGEAVNVNVYDSVESLKKRKTCWKNCGIVELEVRFSKQIEPEKPWSVNETDSSNEE